MTTTPTIPEIESFLGTWSTADRPMRDCFTRFYRELSTMEGVSLSFVQRPGISYSMRARHRCQKTRELLAIVDVIDDDPQARWLSVCFYEDMITDPKGLGEVIPGGLAGGDGYCFDCYDDQEELARYLIDRLYEARAVAAGDC